MFRGGGVQLISHLGGVWGISTLSQQYQNPQILNSVAPCKPECQAFDNGFQWCNGRLLIWGETCGGYGQY